MSPLKFCPQCNNNLFPKDDKDDTIPPNASRNCDHQDVAADPALPYTKSVCCAQCGHGEAIFSPEVKNPKLRVNVSVTYDLEDVGENSTSKKSKRKHRSDYSDSGSKDSVFESSSVMVSNYTSESSSGYSSSFDLEEEARRRRKKNLQEREMPRGYSWSLESSDSDSVSKSESSCSDSFSESKSSDSCSFSKSESSDSDSFSDSYSDSSDKRSGRNFKSDSFSESEYSYSNSGSGSDSFTELESSDSFSKSESLDSDSFSD